jgi:calcineurin-like phosphoesterase
MAKDEPMRRFLQKTPGVRLEPATGAGALAGLAVETDDRSGLATRVAAVRLGAHLDETWPHFWD